MVPDVRVAFAQRLKELRKNAGYRQARSFASAIGVEENRYTRWERGEVEPSLIFIKKICNVLQVTANELLAFEASGARVSQRAMLGNDGKQAASRLQIRLRDIQQACTECLEIAETLKEP